MSGTPFARYLAAKTTVDDRALNRRVWERLRDELREDRAGEVRPLAVVELGAGIGTGLERALDWGLFPSTSASLSCTLVDRDPALIETAATRLGGSRVKLEMQVAEARAFCTDQRNAGAFDLLIGQALLDLLDLEPSLADLSRALTDGGLAYFPITFDGVTVFEPELEDDEAILAIYHRTMDERRMAGAPSGDSKSGRHLIGHLSRAPWELLAVGSSDWIVHPSGGAYPGDEAFFLRTVIDMVASSVGASDDGDAVALDGWILERRRQVDRGQLIFMAHQLDLLARKR